MKTGIVKASELNKRVTIQRATNIYDAAGGTIKSWNDVATIWAKVEEGRGSEFYQNRQFENQQQAILTIRYREDVTVHDRISFDGRFFSIVSIQDKNHRKSTNKLYINEIIR